jgi:hypothetical protein
VTVHVRGDERSIELVSLEFVVIDDASHFTVGGEIDPADDT